VQVRVRVTPPVMARVTPPMMARVTPRVMARVTPPVMAPVMAWVMAAALGPPRQYSRTQPNPQRPVPRRQILPQPMLSR
jgi:hypothetical protein